MGPKSQKSRFQLFGFRKSDGFPPEANASLLASKFWAQIDPSRPNKSKKCGFLALAGAFHSSSKNLHVPKWPDCLINPHQRCVYSDSPFARIPFYSAGFRKGLERRDARGIEVIWKPKASKSVVSPWYTSSILKKGFATVRTLQKTTKNVITLRISKQNMHLAREIKYQGEAQPRRLWEQSRGPETPKK